MAPEFWFAAAAAGLVLAASYAYVFARAAANRRRLARFLARLRADLVARGAEALDEARLRWKGRTVAIRGDIHPLLGPALPLRLSLFAPGDLEFTVRRAQRPPPPPRPGLAADDFYRAFAFEGTITPEVERFLLDPRVRAALADRLGRSWNTFSVRYVERSLSDGALDPREYDGEALVLDLAALESLAAAPLCRRLQGGVWTLRHGFEDRPWVWHWRPEQRLLLPAQVVRFLVSYYPGHPYLTAPLWEFFRELAGNDDLVALSQDAGAPEWRWAWPQGYRLEENRVWIDDPRAVAGMDPYTDGRFVQALVAVPPSGRDMIARAYRGATRRDFHEISLGLLEKLTFYVRRLYDDRFTGLSGEFEILTTRRTRERCEQAARAVADRRHAKVVEISRPFLPKLLETLPQEVRA